MIKIDHISFSYGEENENTGGVRDIDLNIEDGQFVVLCGESGCGKTTITRLINGLIPHYYEGQMAGEVWVNGGKGFRAASLRYSRSCRAVCFKTPGPSFSMWIQPVKLHLAAKILDSQKKTSENGLQKRFGISGWRS